MKTKIQAMYYWMDSNPQISVFKSIKRNKQTNNWEYTNGAIDLQMMMFTQFQHFLARLLPTFGQKHIQSETSCEHQITDGMQHLEYLCVCLIVFSLNIEGTSPSKVLSFRFVAGRLILNYTTAHKQCWWLLACVVNASVISSLWLVYKIKCKHLT